MAWEYGWYAVKGSHKEFLNGSENMSKEQAQDYIDARYGDESDYHPEPK